MNLSHVLTLPWLMGLTLSFGQISEQQALERAKAYCLAVERGPFEPSTTPGHRLEVHEIGRYPGVRQNTISFHFWTAYVGVDLMTGKIVGYHDGRSFPYQMAESLPDLPYEQVFPLINQYYQLAGQSRELVPEWIGQHGATEIDNPYNAHIMVTHGGIPYISEHGLHFIVEEHSGRLQRFETFELDLPEPPNNLIPTVLESEARAQMTAFIFVRYPVNNQLYERSVRLQLWRPHAHERAYAYRNFTMGQVLLIQQNGAILAYRGRFQNRIENDRNTDWFDVFVDAQLGHVLALSYNRGRDAIGGSASGDRRSAFLWDVGPANIRVYHGAKSQRVLNTYVSKTGKPKVVEKGKDVYLHFGKLFLRCRFFRASGLLVTERDGMKSYGKPSSSLLKALRTLTATK